MKKFFLLFCGLIFFLQVVNAQMRDTVWSEHFDGVANSFTSNGWYVTKDYSASGSKSMMGDVPFHTGDSIVLTSPMYDFTTWAHVKLSFKHICKVSMLDIAKIQYRLDAIGTQGDWQDIPYGCYEGDRSAYSSNNNGFSAISYAEWLWSDSLAIPDSSWWREEFFLLSNQVAYEKAQFRFILKKNTKSATQINYGWIVDNFEIKAADYEILLPHVSFISALRGDVYNEGPYLVRAKVATRTSAPILRPWLYYTASHPEDGIVTDSIRMTAYQGDSLWQALIPKYDLFTTITYNIIGRDTLNNVNTIKETFQYIPRYRPDNDVEIVEIVSPLDTVFVGAAYRTVPVKVVIQNTGLLNLTSAVLSWSLNGVVQDSNILWTGNLRIDGRDTLLIGNYQSKLYDSDTIEILVEAPNGDSNFFDNPVQQISYATLLNHAHSVSVEGISSPKRYVNFTKSYPVKVLLRNQGYMPLDSCLIGYSVNGTAPVTSWWKGNITPGREAEIDVNTVYQGVSGKSDTLSVWVSLPNGQVDTILHDDTAILIVENVNGLRGRYTIGSLLSDFKNFDDFVSLLQQTGMDGHVILAFESGIYSPLDLSILASDMKITDTLTITSVTGNAEDVIFRGSASFGYGINMGGNQNINIHHVSSEFCIRFSAPCSNVEISGCHIDGVVQTPPPGQVPIQLALILGRAYLSNSYINGAMVGIRADSCNMGNLRILNNVFHRVSTGILLGTTDSNARVSIIGNDITYWGARGIDANGTRIDYIADNTITKNITVAHGADMLAFQRIGIFLNNVIIDSAITRNHIYFYGGNGTPCGVVCSHVNKTVSYPAIMCNNEITRLYGGPVFSSTQTINYGILLQSENNMEICHNSVYVNSEYGKKNNYSYIDYGLYGDVGYTENVVCKNNIFVSKDYPVDNLPPSVVMDNNNYYSLTKKPYVVNDTHALAVAPIFKDVAQNLEVMNAYRMLCSNVGIQEDINGKARGSSTTMGAYDADFLNVSVAMAECSPVDTVITAPLLQVPVKVQVLNAGNDTLTSAVLGWSLNGVVQDSQLLWTGSLSFLSADTIQIGTYIPKMNDYDTVCVWVGMPNGVLDSNTCDDTITLRVYGTTDLEVAWVKKPYATETAIQPYDVSVKIHSISGLTYFNNIYMHYDYTDSNNVVQKIDSVSMTNMRGEIWKAVIPPIPYGHKVHYSISLTDYVGNVLIMADSFSIDQIYVDEMDVVSMVDVVSPAYFQGISSGNYPIEVVIQNEGKNNLFSCRLGYSINGGTPVFYNWTGNLYTDFTDTVSIGTYQAVGGQEDTLFVWVDMPNGIIDSNVIGDTLSLRLVCCDSAFSGSYTIGKDSSSDFVGVREFLQTASYCGIQGTVTLLVDSGRYEGFDLSVIAGAMTANDTLIITSASGMASDVVFVPASGKREYAIIALADNENIYLKNISADDSDSTHTNGISFYAPCENIEINSCSIKLSEDNYNSCIGGAQRNDYRKGGIRILNNTLSGGSYGISFTGPPFHVPGSKNNIIRGNKITDFYYVGIHGRGNSKFGWIADNEIISNKETATYSICLIYTELDSGIVNNRTNAGISFYYVNKGTSPFLMANNEIYLKNALNNNRGIEATFCNAHYYHNSVYITDTVNSAVAFYLYDEDAGNSIIKNNIFHVEKGAVLGDELFRNLYSYQMDYNNYYSGDSILVENWAFSLSDWQKQGQDVHSVSIRPVYKDTSVSLEVANAEDYMAPNVGIDKDIMGRQRYLNTYMGAYTQTIPKDMDLAMQQILQPEEVAEDVLCIPDRIPIYCVVQNMQDSVIDFSVSPLKLHLEVAGIYPQQYDTTINSGLMEILQIDTIAVTHALDVLSVGNYSLTTTLSCAADTLPGNDTASISFDIYRSILPIDEDFANGMPNTIEVWESNTDSTWAVLSDSGAIVQSQYGNSLLTFDGTRGAEAKLYVKYISLYNSYNPTLEFWYWHDTTAASGKFADIMDVSYTIDGGNSFEKLIQLKKNNGTDHGWKKYTVSLLPANGNSCVVVMFDAIRMSPAQYDGTQYIDRIKVFIGQDIAVSEVLTDEMNSCNLTSDVKVVIENKTNQVINFATDSTSLQLDIIGIGSQSFIYPLSGGILASLGKDTITIASSVDFSTTGNYIVAAKILTPIDAIATNDTISVQVNISPEMRVNLQAVTGENTDCIPIGTQVYQQVSVSNTGNMEMEDIVLTMEISNSNGSVVETIMDTIYGLLMVDSVAEHLFSQAYTVPNDEEYNVRVIASPQCNANLWYDSYVNECVDLSDVEVLEILSPADDNNCSKVGESIKVKVKLRNNDPNNDARGIVLHAEVKDADNRIIGSWAEILDDILSDAEAEFEFPYAFVVPTTKTYTVKAFVDNVDVIASNDTVSIEKCTNVGIDDSHITGLVLYQNVPNPAQESTEVKYYVPEDGSVVFSINTVTGQILYMEEKEVVKGAHSIVFDIENLAEGIYFYTMDFQGQRLMKKMVIKK